MEPRKINSRLGHCVRSAGEPSVLTSSAPPDAELYGFLNPMPFEGAAQMKKDLAEDLRTDGYIVTGST
jgi:hypothetical protein